MIYKHLKVIGRRNKRGRRRKTNSQRLDIKTLVNKTNEIICDTLRKLLPKKKFTSRQYTYFNKIRIKR